MPAGESTAGYVTREAFTVAPDVVYSSIESKLASAINKSDPNTAIARGSFNPVISEAFTVAPEVVYSPIVPGLLTTNRSGSNF
jgi:hypothetical protein